MDGSSALSDSSTSLQTDPFTEFSTFIDKLSPILNEMKDNMEITDLPAIQEALVSLETDYAQAREAILQSQTVFQSSPAKHIEYLTQNLGRSLGLVLFASHDVPLSNKEKIEALCKEMMNVRFDSSSDDFAICYETEEEEEKEEEIIVQKEITSLGNDEIVLEIKHGSDENFKAALLRFSALIMNGMITNEKIVEEELVKVLCSRLRSSKGGERVIIIRILRYLTRQSDQHKEKMKDLEFLSALVKSLARDVEEQREAVGLLLNLSDDSGVRRSIGRIQGCIVMLVAISNGGKDDEQGRASSHDARMLLNAMSGNTQHALHMAEAGYFKPLIKYLKEGSEMSKVLMATALSRLELNDQNKTNLGENGAVEPLVKMFNKGNLEAKLSALNALQNLLSNSKQINIQLLIDSGIVMALLQLLFSITSVIMTLREPASAILAKVAQSENILLVKQDVAQQMLSLLTISSPVIQNNLLEALNNIVLHSSAYKVRKRMKENGAIHLLLNFLSETGDSRIRLGALKLVYVLSKDIILQGEIGYEHINVVANLVSSSSSDCEKAAALGILSNLPVSDGKITDILKNANLLPLMVSLLNLSAVNSRACLDESIAGILIRFTVPTDKKLQHYSAENGVIHLLLKLLSSTSETAKSRSALCLAQLSTNSLSLSKSRKLRWLCLSSSLDSFCVVHDGYCSVKSTFCLVKADVVTTLVQILEGDERGADEAVLSCISTLLGDETWERGCTYLVKKSGVGGIIKVLSSGSLKSREKALWMLERIFRVEAYREEYGESAQAVLIDLTQNGDPILKPTVAKLLAQLELLQVQSSYF